MVFEEKKSFKMSKNLNFVKLIGLGLNFTYELKVCLLPDEQGMKRGILSQTKVLEGTPQTFCG